ncbi:MAG: type II toxin-antitoxin system HicA family toxin [Candidatus Nealsonbacteria bacterium]
MNIANCSWKKLVNLAKKCGFYIKEGGNHTKVENKEGKFITTIPRKNRLNKHTVNGIIKRFKECGCMISI